jgi:hypothetical protein
LNITQVFKYESRFRKESAVCTEMNEKKRTLRERERERERKNN